MASSAYATELYALQVQIVETQAWAMEQGLRVLILFEGRDTAGKDGAIKRLTENMAPRNTRIVALPKPTDRETAQWYFQRYAPHLPADGEIVIFNRSWYNRAGVEPVMGFCTSRQYEDFLNEVDNFERILSHAGIIVIKLWLDISRNEQSKRLSERLNDPVKHFKISPLDKEAQTRWTAYSKARDRMLDETHFDHAPWTIIATDQKKEARLNIIRHILHRLNRPGLVADKPDPDIVFSAHHSKGRLAP